MTTSIKLSVVLRRDPWLLMQMLYTWHGRVVAERFVVGMN